ncbi:MAG: hypothetical protein ACYC63_18090 [Armatimonadota bacterium]
MRAEEHAAGVLRTASQPDDVAGDAVPAAQRDVLLQSRLIAEFHEALAQIQCGASLARRPGGPDADRPRQILRRGQRAQMVEIMK